MTHTVGDVARLAGITVRTLHHYDEIGLLSPSERSDTGYRLYDLTDIAQLQQILFYRELGLPLEKIQNLLADPEFDRLNALRHQRDELSDKASHLGRMIEAIDAALEAEQEGVNMTSQEMLEVFGEFDPAEYAEEVERRWGGSDRYRESSRRTSRYERKDWDRQKAEAAEIDQAFLDLMAAGVAADSTEAQDLAERHRAHISEWFYECTPEIHFGLGHMYADDKRFTESIDKAGEGLAAYMSAAIIANA